MPALVFAALTMPVSAAGKTASETSPDPGVTVAGAVPSETEVPPPTAPVMLDGATLFRLRGISAFPAEKRSQVIADRIEALARDSAVPSEALRVVEAEGRSTIIAGERPVMAVLDADARQEGVERQVLAQAYVIRIAEAVTAYRTDRRPHVLLRNTLYSLGATLLLVIALLIIRKGFGRLGAALERRYKARIHALRIETLELVQAEQLWGALRGSLRAIAALLVVVSVYVYLHFVLSLYPWTRSFAQRLLNLLLEPLATMGVGLLASVPGLVFIAVLIVVTRYLLALARMFFAAVADGRVRVSGFDLEWAWPTYRIIRLFAIAFAVVVAYPYIPGSDSAAFKGVSIFLGVIFSLGSSTVIANVIAGYTMTYRRAFRVGDRIRVSDFTGDVEETRLLVTRLRTPKNEEIVVPNSLILTDPIVNYSSLAREHGLILHTTVGIGYEVPWRQVEAMLLLAAERTPGPLRDPKPFVLERSLGDFCVTYELNVYCDKPRDMFRLYALLHQNVLDTFNEFGIQIMTPAYEGDPERPKVVPRDHWFAAPARVPHQQAQRGVDESVGGATLQPPP